MKSFRLIFILGIFTFGLPVLQAQPGYVVWKWAFLEEPPASSLKQHTLSRRQQVIQRLDSSHYSLIESTPIFLNQRTFNTYLPNGKINTKLTLRVVAGTWQETQLDSHIYSNNYQQESRIILTKNSSSPSSWNRSIMEMYTFNTAGEIIEKVIKSWQNNDWTSRNRYLNTYLNDTLLTTTEFFSWVNGDWMPIYKYVGLYGASNQPTLSHTLFKTVLGWDTSAVKQVVVYPSASTKPSAMVVVAKRPTGTDTNSKLVYAYESGGDRLAHEVFQNFSNGTWNNFRKEAYEYDAQGNNVWKQRYFWSSGNAEWSGSSRIENYFTEMEIAQNKPKNEIEPLTIFPNPACNELNVATQNNLALLKIVDALGKERFQTSDYHQLAQHRIRIDVSGLKHGIYRLCYQTMSGKVGSAKWTKN